MYKAGGFIYFFIIILLEMLPSCTDFQTEIHQVEQTSGRLWNPFFSSQPSSWEPNYPGAPKSWAQACRLTDAVLEAQRPPGSKQGPSRSLTMAAPKQTGARQAVLQAIKRVSLKRGTFPRQALFASYWQIKADTSQYTLFHPVQLSNRRCFVGKGSAQF